MEIKSNTSLSYTANVVKNTKQAEASFGAKISDLAHKKKNDAVPTDESFGVQVSELAHAKKADKIQIQESAVASAKKQLNQGILQASMDVSLSVGNEPMTLLFKTAIEGVNKALEGQLGANAIQKTYDAGIDVSPQATADRIVQMSTAFFDKYYANHPDLSVDEALNSFTKLIGGGIDKGFKEARDILSGLNVLNEGNIGSNIDATYNLVQDGLKAFVDHYSKPKLTEPVATV